MTLDELKKAIEAVDQAWKDDNVSDYRAAVIRAEAWRSAFEWREGWRKRCQDIAPQSIQWSAHCDEGDEGMRLILERLS